MERNRIELKQAEAKRIKEQKKRVEQQRQKAEEQSQKTEEGKTQGETAQTTIPQSPNQQPSSTPIPETTNARKKSTPQDAPKVKRGRRKQNSPPATPKDETPEHSARPSRSSILRQRKTLSPQILEQSSSNPKSTRSKTSEGAPISESKNALDALAENIAKLTTQQSQQDNHPTYTQADVENFLKKSGNKVSDNEVTITVRGGDVTINGNPLEKTEI